MADLDPRYPCSSIEDDFNYGSCVASASVHIRMGTSPGPSRPALGGPAASPASGGWFSDGLGSSVLCGGKTGRVTTTGYAKQPHR